MRDNGAQTQTIRSIPTEQHAVGAFVSHHRLLLGGPFCLSRLRPADSIQNTHNFRRRCILETDHFDLAVADLVDAANDAHQSRNVFGAIRHDQHIGRRVRGKMALLRDQRSQNGYQLCGCHVVDLHHTRNHFIAVPRCFITDTGNGVLLGTDVRQYLDNGSTGNSGKTVHLQD